MHARRLRDVVRAHLDDPRELAEAWDAVTEAELTPWYRDTVAEDRTRLREIEALRNGFEPPPPAEADALRAAMIAGLARDADVFRAFLESRCCITAPGGDAQPSRLRRADPRAGRRGRAAADPGPEPRSAASAAQLRNSSRRSLTRSGWSSCIQWLAPSTRS